MFTFYVFLATNNSEVTGDERTPTILEVVEHPMKIFQEKDCEYDDGMNLIVTVLCCLVFKRKRLCYYFGITHIL